MRGDDVADEVGVRNRTWQVTAAFVIAVLILAGAAGSARMNTQRLVDADARSSEAYKRIAQLSAVLDAATDAETGSRGFVITGDAAFLVPYDRGIATASDELDRLEALYAGDALRLPLLRRVRTALGLQIAHMGRSVELRRSQGASAAAQFVATGRGMALTNEVRAAIAALVTDERATLERERAEVEAATVAANRTLMLEGVIGVLLFAIAFIALIREAQSRRAATAEVRELNRTLESRIEKVRADLAQSEAGLRNSLDRMLEGCGILDSDFRYIYVNPAFAQQGRTSVDKMIGRTFFEVYPGSEGSELVAAKRRALEERVSQEIELEFTFPDGSAGWFEVHIHPVPEGLLLLSFETTNRVKAEKARTASEGRLRALLESLPEQVFVLNRRGEVLDFHCPPNSPPLAPPEELTGRPLLTALSPVAAEQLGAAIRRVADTGATQTVQFASDSADRSRKYEAVVVSTEGDRLTVVVRDITARENLEEQLRQSQKMEAVGQLTGGIAHDFNNVLTIIGSNADLLATQGDARTTESLELREIQTATRRGAEMISRLLAFSRRGLLTRRHVELRTVVRDFSTMLQHLIPAHIRLEIGPLDASESVNLDAGALEQVIANLCTNARDAMPEGGTLRIDCQSTWLDAGYHATHPWVTPGPYVCVSVSDTGKGMDERTRARIFEPFFTTKPTGVGTGLGMSMVYGMMKEHDGMVHVYSEVGIGTVVKLYFPVAQGAVPDRVPRRTSNPNAIVGGNECLLVAEDEPSIRLASRRALESKGYEVLDAADGEQALGKWRQNRERIALVISDLVMPNLGGVQLAQALRAEGSTVPVIFTSGYSSEALSREGSLPEGVQFLDKPWTLLQLFSTVRAVLDSRNAE